MSLLHTNHTAPALTKYSLPRCTSFQLECGPVMAKPYCINLKSRTIVCFLLLAYCSIAASIAEKYQFEILFFESLLKKKASILAGLKKGTFKMSMLYAHTPKGGAGAAGRDGRVSRRWKKTKNICDVFTCIRFCPHIACAYLLSIQSCVSVESCSDHDLGGPWPHGLFCCQLSWLCSYQHLQGCWKPFHGGVMRLNGLMRKCSAVWKECMLVTPVLLSAVLPTSPPLHPASFPSEASHSIKHYQNLRQAASSVCLVLIKYLIKK